MLVYQGVSLYTKLAKSWIERFARWSQGLCCRFFMFLCLDGLSLADWRFQVRSCWFCSIPAYGDHDPQPSKRVFSIPDARSGWGEGWKTQITWGNRQSVLALGKPGGHWEQWCWRCCLQWFIYVYLSIDIYVYNVYTCMYVHMYIYIYTYTSRRNFHRPHFKYKIVVSPQGNVNFGVKKGVSESEGLTFAATCISTWFFFCGPRVFKVKTVAWYTLLLFSASDVGFPIGIGKIEYSERSFYSPSSTPWLWGHCWRLNLSSVSTNCQRRLRGLTQCLCNPPILHTPHSFAMVALSQQQGMFFGESFTTRCSIC